MLANMKDFTANPHELSNKGYERFAIYYVPKSTSELAEFGRKWFSVNASEGDDGIRIFGLDRDVVSRIIKVPARYGLHATLKAPFHLAESYSLEQLTQKVKRFAENRKCFSLGRLQVGWFGDSMVLVLAEDTHQVNQFASQCVLGFEDFRAPLTVKERTKRMGQNLNLHQHLMLEELGYPYVLSEFRFHITLTSSLSEEDKAHILPKLRPVLKHICSEPYEVDGIALVGDPGNENPFEIIERFDLAR